MADLNAYRSTDKTANQVFFSDFDFDFHPDADGARALYTTFRIGKREDISATGSKIVVFSER